MLEATKILEADEDKAWDPGILWVVGRRKVS